MHSASVSLYITLMFTHSAVFLSRFIFFFAGADTSSTAIAYGMVELGHHPEIQEKLRKEILEKTKDSNGEITYDNLHEMTYLNQVVSGKENK